MKSALCPRLCFVLRRLGKSRKDKGHSRPGPGRGLSMTSHEKPFPVWFLIANADCIPSHTSCSCVQWNLGTKLKLLLIGASA